MAASIAVVFCLAANASRSAQYWRFQSPAMQQLESIFTPIGQMTDSKQHRVAVELYQPKVVEPDANKGLAMAQTEETITLNVTMVETEEKLPLNVTMAQTEENLTLNVTMAKIEETVTLNATSEDNRRNQSNNLPSETTNNSCGNSIQWLQGLRRGNMHDDPFLTNDLVQSMILDTDKMLQKDKDMTVVLGQTICHPQSRFLNGTRPIADQRDECTIRVWAVKLIYLAVHYHQHRHATVEAAARYSRDGSQCPSADQLSKDYNVSMSDGNSDETKKQQSRMTESAIGLTTERSSWQSRWDRLEGKVPRGAGSEDRRTSRNTG
jgi:hypothetical protein